MAFARPQVTRRARLPRRAYAGIVSRQAALAVDAGLLTVTSLAVALLPGLARQQMTNTSPGSAFGVLLAPLWLFGLSAVLWDGHRRAWHDRIFGTVVRYAGKRDLN